MDRNSPVAVVVVGGKPVLLAKTPSTTNCMSASGTTKNVKHDIFRTSSAGLIGLYLHWVATGIPWMKQGSTGRSVL